MKIHSPLVRATIIALAGTLSAAGPTAQVPAGRGGAPAPLTSTANAEPQTFPLWTDGAPGALGTSDADIPTLTVYLPNGRGAGTALVIAPGGGYEHLSMNLEGRQIANWANALGVTAFVLKYRLGPQYHHPIELGDAARAIRTVRARASEFNVLPDRVGMMGFSAGGHLTATVATHFDAGAASAVDPIDRVSSRPDFLVLAYPVITMTTPFVHAGSRRALLGPSPDAALIDALSNERHVTKDTPPTFLFHTTSDTTVPVENSVMFYLALRKAGVPVEMHIFQTGAHGAGLGMFDPALQAWPTLAATWLRGRGLLTR